MKNYKYIAFDLDGTLTDPAKGLIEGFVYAFRKHGIDIGEREALKRYIGPPLFESWQRDFSLSPTEAERLVLTFREYYNVYGWWENMLYPGIAELLGASVDTEKREHALRRILGLRGCNEECFTFLF